MIVAIVAVVFGFWYGSRLVLNTDCPALAVTSRDMCLLPGLHCDGWSHPFERSLHIGDLVIVQGINASNVKAAQYPDGDIIVFRRGDELIIHRAIEKRLEDGHIFYVTKGDGNPGADSESVSEDQVVGKVILRIPWIGHLALFMQGLVHDSSGTYLIIAVLIILIIAELLIPMVRRKKG